MSSNLFSTDAEKQREADIRRVLAAGWKPSVAQIDHFWSPDGRRRVPLTEIVAELNAAERAKQQPSPPREST